MQTAVSVPRLFLPVVGNGLKHDAKLGDEQCGEHQEKEGEGDLHVRHRQTGHGRIDRQQVLDSPRLATHFGHDPSGLLGQVDQHEAPQAHVQQPALFGEGAFATVPNEEAHDEDECAAGADHDAEGPIDHAEGRNEIFDLLDVAVAEVGLVVLKHFSCRVGAFGRFAPCGTVVFEGRECSGAALHLFGGGEHGVAVVVGVAVVENVVNAGHEGFWILVCHEREGTGHFDAGYDAEGSAGRTLAEAFGGCQLHGLMAGDVFTAAVAGEGHDEARHESDDGSDLDALRGEFHVAAAEQEPAAHGHDKDGSREPAARDGVAEFVDRERLESYAEEVHHLVAHGVGIEVHARGMLHPAVGHEDPPSRDGRPQAGEPGRGEVEAFADFAPAEEHEGDEGRFHEEGQDAFDGQRGAENVADKPGIVAPVGAEFKFENDTRCHSDGEIDAKEFLPELGGFLPEFVAGAIVTSFHNGHHERQSEGEGDEEPMIACGKRELRSRPAEDGEVGGVKHHHSVREMK